MPEHDIDPRFERHLEQRLRTYAEQGVRPFDAVEIAHTAATGRHRPAAQAGGLGRLIPQPVRLVALTALLLVALTVTAFAAGLLPVPLPVEPSPSPTTAPVDSPTPTLPGPTETPTTEPSPDLTPSPALESPPPGPTLSPEPASPSPEPTISPTPATPTVGEWRRLTDFPLGDGRFVVVRAVTVGGPGFVAVGFVSDGAGNVQAGRAWTSPGGRSWTIVDSDSFAGARLEHVVEHMGTLYAFGPIPTDDPDFPDLGAYNVWRSADGRSWELLPQPAAFAEQAVVAGATSAGETLVAWGQRNVEEGGAVVVRPGIWTLTAGSGDWRLSDTLPDTFGVTRMAYADGVLVMIGNNRADRAPWRTIWYSTDEGRSWLQADAPYLNDDRVTLEDIAAGVDPAPADHTGGVYATVGWQGRNEETSPAILSTTYYRDWFTGGPLTGYVPFQWERVVAIAGGFLALGTEYRFELNENCAPGPCEEMIPIAARVWTASAVGTHWADGYGGLVWDEAASPSAALWFYSAVAAGSDGIVIVASDPDFNRSVWFAPLASPIP